MPFSNLPEPCAPSVTRLVSRMQCGCRSSWCCSLLSHSNAQHPLTDPVSTSPHLQVSPFQALLLVKSFQPDRLQTAMSTFVCSALNIRSVAPHSAGVKQVCGQHLGNL